MGTRALARWSKLPVSKSAPRAFWADMILSVSSMRVGNEPQGNAHHHGQLMDRQPQLLQRPLTETPTHQSGQWERWYRSAGRCL